MPKIMFLNTWGGSLAESLFDYVNDSKSEVDIFCFSEVYRCVGVSADAYMHPVERGHRVHPLCIKLYDVLQEILGGSHDGYFTPHMYKHLHDLEHIDLPVQYGLAMFVHKSLPVIDLSTRMIVGKFNHHFDGQKASRAIQSACIHTGEENVIVAHFHGLWNGNGKGDTSERIMQSMRVLETLKEQSFREQEHTRTVPKIILGGDFNLTSDSHALSLLVQSEIFGKDGGVCLNTEFGIHDTRTSFYPAEKKTREADFVIASRNVDVTWFDAPSTPEVSDHRPLTVTFD